MRRRSKISYIKILKLQTASLQSKVHPARKYSRVDIAKTNAKLPSKERYAESEFRQFKMLQGCKVIINHNAEAR